MINKIKKRKLKTKLSNRLQVLTQTVHYAFFNPIVNIAFSGGRTSAYLVEQMLIQNQTVNSGGYHNKKDCIIIFANTGWEHEKTLEFVNNCDQHWQRNYGVSVVWLEAAVIHDKRKPSEHRLIGFDSASRDQKPFYEVVKKYGLPNKVFLHCTRELKENPIMSYMQLIGEKIGCIKNGKFKPASYKTYIGIRADEPKRLGGRMNGKQFKQYPLAMPKLSCDKLDVLDFWENMSFDLNIPEHWGNCVKRKNTYQKLVYSILKMKMLN